MAKPSLLRFLAAQTRWFSEMDEHVVKVPGKSTLQRYANWLPAEEVRVTIDELTVAAAGEKEGTQAHPMESAHAVELDTVWMDTQPRVSANKMPRNAVVPDS